MLLLAYAHNSSRKISTFFQKNPDSYKIQDILLSAKMLCSPKGFSVKMKIQGIRKPAAISPCFGVGSRQSGEDLSAGCGELRQRFFCGR
jgi:hypothetical protein